MKRTKYNSIFIKSQPTGDVYMTRAFRKNGLDKVVLCPVKDNTLKDAYEVLKSLEARYDRPGSAMSHKITIGELYSKYIDEEEDRFKSNEITWATLNEKKSTFELLLLPFFKDTKIADMSYGKDLWRDWRKLQTRKTLYHPKKVFKHFLNWAKNEDYLDRVIDLPIPDWEEREGKDLGWTLVLDMITIAETQDLKDFITLAVLTGMRRNEILELSWDRVYLETRQLKTKAHASQTKPPRVISYNSEVEEVLMRRLVTYKGSGWVFPKSTDNLMPRTWDGLKNQWAKLKKDLNLTDVVPQDLRVTWENEARRQGVPEALRLKYAGHSKDVSDEHYMRFNAQELKVVSDAVTLKSGTKAGLTLIQGA